MKYCPTCRANYKDDDLSFCLNDGTALLSNYEEQVTRVINQTPTTDASFIQNTAPNYTNRNSNEAAKSKTVLIVGVIAGFFLLLAISGAAGYLFYAKKDIQTLQSAMPSPSVTSKDDDELKQKIANLERQLQEQKKSGNQTTKNTASAAKTPAPLNQNGKAVAQVKQTGDGFLALRTEPSVKTGTQLVKIPSGAKVEMENCQTSPETIDGRRGRWCMVTYDGKIGWAFDAWLNY